MAKGKKPHKARVTVLAESDSPKYRSTAIDRVSEETAALIREHAELVKKIEDLEAKTGAPLSPTPWFVALDETDRLLVLNQLAAMSTCAYNLNVRVERAVRREAKG